MQVTVEGIIVAGSADLKHALLGSGLVDPRITAAVMKVLDVAYGSWSGLSEVH